MTPLISFGIPMTADEETVLDVVASIYEYFGMDANTLVRSSPNDAPSGAVVAASSTAHAANPVTLQPAAPAYVPPAPSGNLPVAVLAATPSNLVETDNEGLPWDARIHSSNKKKTGAGVWNRRKGVADATVTAIKAELHRTIAATASVVHSAAASALTPADPKAAALNAAHAHALTVAGPQIVDDAALASLLDGKPATLAPAQADWYGKYYDARNAAYAHFISGGASIPAAAVVTQQTQQPDPVPPAADSMAAFVELITWVSGNVAAGNITNEQANAAAKAFGCVDGAGNGALTVLATRSEFISPIRAMLSVQGAK